MASDLLSIGRSGTQTARVALDVTAQNIANAATEGYVRRTVQLEEVSSAGGPGRTGDVSLSGVRLGGVVRNADAFRQAEVRRTGADAARADSEVSGLENIEAAIEQAGVFPAIVRFEGSFQQLSADPIDPSLRAAVIEEARTMARTFNIAATSLDSVGHGLRFEAADGVEQVNTLGGELSRVNLRLARAADSSSDQTSLLDQRDLLLSRLSQYADVSTTIARDQTVEVRLGGGGGPLLVSGGTASALSMSSAANGTIAFALGGTSFAPAAGSLAGKAQALDKLVDVRAGLDGIAASMITAINAAQTSGAALDGSPGQPLLGGTDAASMTLGFENGRGLATAPSGAAPGSRDPAGLNALRGALTSSDPAGAMDELIFEISSTVSGRNITREALETIASSASSALQTQSGVDLDQEAANLIRFQQAFQASGRAMQVASDLFDTLLAIR